MFFYKGISETKEFVLKGLYMKLQVKKRKNEKENTGLHYVIFRDNIHRKILK